MSAPEIRVLVFAAACFVLAAWGLHQLLHDLLTPLVNA